MAPHALYRNPDPKSGKLFIEALILEMVSPTDSRRSRSVISCVPWNQEKPHLIDNNQEAK